jgi:hypothetical protein
VPALSIKYHRDKLSAIVLSGKASQIVDTSSDVESLHQGLRTQALQSRLFTKYPDHIKLK